MVLKTSKLRDMSPEELDREETDLRDAIWKQQLQKSTGQVQDPNKLRGIRRDLARVLTIRRERELARPKGAVR